MKKTNRIFSLILALVMCLSISIPAFATEVPTEDNILVSQSNEGITPMSNISGYGSATIKPGKSDFVVVYCQGSGIGGMGITVKTTCSAGTVNNVTFAGKATSSVLGGAEIDGTMSTNASMSYHNLYNGGVSVYSVLVQIPANAPGNVFVEVWVYG